MNESFDFEYMKFQYEKEELHPVFATVLDTFPDMSSAIVRGQTCLWNALQQIKYNLGNDIDFQTYLLPKYINGIKNTAYDERKVQLPAICYNASFNGYKNTAHIKTINNIMFLDIDNFPSIQEALEYKKIITEKYLWIVACNLSLSRLGLHIIALVDNVLDSKDFINKYEFISMKYFDNRLDEKSKKLTQFTILPFDYDIYINDYPEVLPIDIIYSEHKKSIRSAYIKPNVDIKNNEKSICSPYMLNDTSSISITESISSAYMQDDSGIREEEKKIIYTTHTFLNDSSLNNAMNDAAKYYKLRFRLETDESLISDPNIPLYVREGIDVMEVNLFSLRGKKIPDGNRHNFIGALTVRMLYLNAGSKENQDNEVRTAILKFIKYINNKICDPPLTYDEIIKSYNANWKKYNNGEMDFSKYFIKKRSFWSKHSTLSANEKRKVTCRLKNEPIVEETKRRIYEAIESLMAGNDKINQVKVAKVSKLSIATIKKYWESYKVIVKNHNLSIIGNNKPITKSTRAIQQQVNKIIPAGFDATSPGIKELIVPDKKTNNAEIQNIEEIELDKDNYIIEKEATQTSENTRIIFDRIFEKSLKRLNNLESSNELYNIFTGQLKTLPETDIKILALYSQDIGDSDTFFKQANLDNKLLVSVLTEYEKTIVTEDK